MQMKDSLARGVLLACVICFSLDTLAGDAPVQYDPHQLRAVEKRLREYLNNRVLAFRKGEISRHHIRFDGRSRPATESGLELTSRPNAILFTAITLDPEQLVILGEAARIPAGARKPILSRHAREFRLVTCTVMLDIPPDELTFTHAIGLLSQVFLTKEEFQRATLGQVSDQK